MRVPLGPDDAGAEGEKGVPVLVILTPMGPFPVGQVYLFQLFGATRDAMFAAEVMALRAVDQTINLAEACELLLQPRGNIIFEKASRDARRWCASADATLAISDQSPIGIKIQDASIRGIGFICHSKLMELSEGAITFSRGGSDIQLSYVIKYCAPIGTSEAFRIGAEITASNRISAAQWSRFHDELCTENLFDPWMEI